VNSLRMSYFDMTSAKFSISWATIWCVETVKFCCVSVIASGVASEPADFVFAVRTGPHGNGRIAIAANGQPVALVTGHIGHDGVGLGAAMYFKFGPYRAGQDSVWTVLYDRFRRGARCSDVTAGAVCDLW